MACLSAASNRRAVAMLIAVDAICDMTPEALENVQETGADTIHDVERVLGGMPRAALLAECLSGADADRVNGWNDYVVAVYGAVDAFREVLPDSMSGMTTAQRHAMEAANAAAAEAAERYRD